MRSRLSQLVLVLLGAVLLLVALTRWLPSLRPGAGRRATVSGAAFPLTVTDVRGVKVTIPRKPERIISIAPNNTEILFAIGAGPRVVADSDFCDYPPAAAKLPKVGGYTNPNVEKVVSLNPDLVLATRGAGKGLLDRMTALHVPVICLDPESLPETVDAIRLIGAVVGETVNAEQLAATIEARRAAVLAKTKALPKSQRPLTLFLFSLGGDLYSVGPGSSVDAMIADAGGRNLGATTQTPWPVLSREAVLAADPEVILVVGGSAMSKPLTNADALKFFRADRRWRDVRAVKAGRVAVLDADEMTLPGPRMIDGTEHMAAVLHPELFTVTSPPQPSSPAGKERSHSGDGK